MIDVKRKDVNKNKRGFVYKEYRFLFMSFYFLFFGLFIFLIYVIDGSKKTIIDQRKECAKQIVKSIVQSQEEARNFSKLIFENWADQINLSDQINENPCQASVLKLVEKDNLFLYYVVSDEKGVVVCASIPNSKGVNIEDRQYYQDVVAKKEMVIGQYQTAKVTGRPSVNLAYPVLDNELNNIKKVLILAINLDWFDEKIMDIQFSSQSKLSIVDSDGAILASYPNTGKEIEGETANINPKLLSLILSNNRGAVTGEEIDGSDNVYAFDTLKVVEDDNSVGFYSILTLSEEGVIKTTLKWTSFLIKLILGLSGLSFVCLFVWPNRRKND